MGTFSESSKKAETFSLAWRPFIATEDHASFGFKDVKGTKVAAGEPSDRILKNKGAFGADPNQPLCPLLPAVARNKENKLALHLETSTLERKLVQ